VKIICFNDNHRHTIINSILLFRQFVKAAVSIRLSVPQFVRLSITLCKSQSNKENKKCRHGSLSFHRRRDFGVTRVGFSPNQIIKKAKVPHNRLESPEGGRGIALLSLDLGARRWWVLSTTLRQLCPWERPGTHCTGADLDVCEKPHSCRDSIPRPVQPVASRYTDWAIPVHKSNYLPTTIFSSSQNRGKPY
jgi:hypothetical protein